jgi:hypothetical protein
MNPPARAKSGNKVTAGRRTPRVSLARCSGLVPNTGDDSIRIASTPKRLATRIESARFARPRTSSISRLRFSALPADLTPFICTGPVAGSHNTAIFVSWGIASFSNSSHFLLNSGKSKNTPVTCPPGRDKLVINPLATGSDSRSSAMIGIVVLAD